MAGINAARFVKGCNTVVFPRNTALGALANYISDKSIVDFQPMKMNYGIFEPPNLRLKKELRRKFMFERALKEIDDFKKCLEFKF
jgi:methylenetetrahydrofolate--tRNA-(uracil-5-)-methyltransferase